MAEENAKPNGMVHSALQAAETLAAQGISAEVVDPRCLVPLDKDIILNSVKKTHALVVAHEAVKTAGAGAEIAAMSCADCHAEQADHQHPRADKLNKPASTAFDRETCLQCHGEVEDNLAKGTHGGKPVMKTQDYNNCVTCHNPHYVLAPEARAKGLRPAGDMLVSPTILTRRNLEELRDAGADKIGVAIDLATPELFDHYRGSGVGGPHSC